MDLKNKKINFLGDSITEGAAASNPDNIYHQILKRECNLAKARNYGISGTRIARQKNLSKIAIYDKDFILRAAEMDTDADIIMVFGGTNDFGHGDASMGSFGDRTEYSFYGACHILYNKLLNKYKNSHIIIITPLHRTGEDNLKGEGNKPCNAYTLKEYVKVIKEVAAYYKLPIIDLFGNDNLNPNIINNNTRYFADGLHPNNAGHALIAKIIREFIEKI